MDHRLDDDPPTCPGDCDKCELYPFCSQSGPMVEDIQCEEVYDDSNRLHPV